MADSVVSYTNATTTLKMTSLSIAAVGTYPLGDKFNILGKFGISKNSADASGTGAASGFSANSSTSGVMIGLGAQFNFNSRDGIRLLYESRGKSEFIATDTGVNLPASSIGITVVSIGIVHNFGH